MIRACAQIALLLILSRTLDSQNYGVFITTVAIGALLTPIAGLGLQAILLRDGSRNPALLPALLRQHLSLICIAVPICGTLAVIYALVTLSIVRNMPLLAMACAMCTDIALVTIAELVSRVEQARGRINQFGMIQASAAIARLSAVVALYFLSNISIQSWLWAYTLSGMVLLGFYWMHATRLTNSAPKMSNGTKSTLFEALPFALGALSMKLQGEYNKPQLARVGFDQSGIFNVVQRAMDALMLPVLAMQETLWPRLYARPQQAPMLALIIPPLLMAVLAGVACWVIAPIIPRIVGPAYQDGVEILRQFAALPLIQCMRMLITVELTHRHQTQVITAGYAAGAVASVVLTTFFVQLKGMQGAVLAMYLAEIVISSVLLTALVTKKRTLR